jgi:hypothetical protein
MEIATSTSFVDGGASIAETSERPSALRYLC